MLLHIIFEFLRSFYVILIIEKAFKCLHVLLQLQIQLHLEVEVNFNFNFNYKVS